MDGLDIPVFDADYEAEGEIIISIFENSSFLPHSPISTVKLELKDLIQSGQSEIMENEPCKFSNCYYSARGRLALLKL